jgi:hypothetical protein
VSDDPRDLLRAGDEPPDLRRRGEQWGLGWRLLAAAFGLVVFGVVGWVAGDAIAGQTGSVVAGLGAAVTGFAVGFWRPGLF